MKRVILPIVLMAAVTIGSAPAWTQTKTRLAAFRKSPRGAAVGSMGGFSSWNLG